MVERQRGWCIGCIVRVVVGARRARRGRARGSGIGRRLFITVVVVAVVVRVVVVPVVVVPVVVVGGGGGGCGGRGVCAVGAVSVGRRAGRVCEKGVVVVVGGESEACAYVR